MKTLNLAADRSGSFPPPSVSRSITVLILSALLASKCLGESTITNVIAGVIGVPGERAVYTFSLAGDSRFYFDALTNVANLQWSLSGPQGLVVANRSFSGSDAQSIGDPTMDLRAGAHTLTIQDPGGATNGYAFRLVNLAEATLLTPGAVVTNTLSPANQSDFYQFTALAGDRFYFQRIARTGLPSAWWRLLDPYGTQVFSQGFNDVGTASSPVTLPATGTYTVLLEGYIGDTGSGSYSFNVVPEGHVTPPAFTGEPMNLGDLIVSNLVANTTNAYIFTLANAARIVFDTQTNSPNLNWTLRGPPGVIVNQRGFNVSDAFYNFGPFNLPAGDYQLRVQGNANNPYVFRLLDLATATAFTPGTPVTNTLSPAGATVLYQFTIGSAGKYFFNYLSSVGGLNNAWWRLVDPYNNSVFGASLDSDQGPLALNNPGTYALLVEGYFNDIGSGTNRFNVVPVTDGLQALTLGGTVAGAIASPGQRQQYTFLLAAGARLYFDSQTNTSQLRWALDGPTGSFISNSGFSSDNNLGSLPAGNYTLTVSATGDYTGGYQFRLFDLATAAALTPGVPVSDTLNPANSTKAYQFTLGTPGKYFFNHQSSSGAPNAGWRLLDPQRALVFNTNLGSDQGPFNLQAGTYTLLVEGYVFDTGSGNYTFNVVPVTDGSQALTVGSTVTGAITTPGQRQQYTFTLPAATLLYYDALTNVSGLRWYLEGPTGTVVNNAGINGDSLLGTLTGGLYTLTVFANNNNDTTGSYQFRLIDLATAGPLTPGTPLSGTLNPANSTVAYQFTVGSAGKYFFNHQTSTSLPNASWQLLDPRSAVVFNSGLGGDQGPLNLLNGTYTLLVQGYINEPGSGNFTFNVLPVADGSQPLTLGGAVSGAVATPGQQQRHTFTLPTAARLYFDSLTNNSALRWSLDGPTGRLVNNFAFSTGDDYLGNLPAGNYTITVFAGGSSDITSGYQFRLLDLATASATNLNFTAATTNPPPPIVELRAGWPSSGVLAAGRAFAISVGAVADQPVTNLTITATGAFSTNQTFAGGGPYALTYPLAGGASPGSTVQFTATARDALGRLSAPATLTLNVASATGQPSPVVYYSRAGSPDGQLWAAALDGSFDAPLITGEQPRVSPDGRWLAFHKDDANYSRANVYVVDLQTGNVRLLLGNPDLIIGYSWSPDNSRLIFDYSCGIEQVNLDGGNRRQLFGGNCYDDAPAVNILDGRVAFHNTVAGGGIGLANANGTGKLFIPNTAPIDVWPAWSPDGQSISFQNGTNYFKIHPDGTGLTQLTAVPAVGDSFNGPGSWTPDGTHLVTAGKYNGVNGLYSVATDGSKTVALIPTSAGAAIDFVGSVIAVPSTSVPFVGASLNESLAISGSVSPANSATAWKFFAQAGQLLTFLPGSQSGFIAQGQPRWLLQDPLGNVLFENWFTTAVSPITAPFDGNYTLVVYGWINETAGSGSFNLQILSSGNIPVENTFSGTPLALGTVVSNNVSIAQTVDYTFTLASQAQLIFDSLTQNDQIHWSLTGGGSGHFVSGRSFQASDSIDISDALLTLPAGQYQLSVNSTAAATNAFQFRLLDFASAATFAPGTVVSNTLSPANGSALHQFSGNTGDRYYFDGQTASGFTYTPGFRLYAPLGNIIQSGSVNSDVDTFTLPQTGTYTLAVEGRIYDPRTNGNYAFNLVPETYPTNALVIGNTVSNSISVPGRRHYFTFTLPAAATLYFDALTNADFNWRLDGQWGQVIDWRSFASSDGNSIGNPALPLGAGSYTLGVAGSGFSVTGGYQFRLLNFTNATSFTPGTIVSNTLVPANGTEFYQFTSGAGDRYYFDGRPMSGFTYSPYCRIYGPLGNIIQAMAVNGDVDTFALPQAGTYTLTVEGYIYDTHTNGNYAFNLVPEAYPTNALVIGNSVSNSIPVPGQRHYFTFTLPAAATLYFDALTNADFNWRLDGAWGQVVDWRSFANSDANSIGNPALPLGAGSYTLGVAGNGFSVTGGYQFRLLNFTNATSFTPGTIVSNTLAPANGTEFYQFTSGAGDRYYFDGRPTSGFTYSPYCRIYGPLGNIIQAMAVNGDEDTFVLSQAGTYTLTVEGYIYDTHTNGNYAFNLVPNPVVPPQPIFTTNVTPDLIVSTVTVTPGALQSGGPATVHWTDRNAGNGSTSGSFTDRVTIRNAANLVLVDTFLGYNEADAGNGPIAASGSRDRELAVTLPDGTNSVGTLQVTVTTDTQNGIAENNEANNSASTSVTATLAPYPDLLVGGLATSPTTGWLPGSLVTLNWRLTNSGAGVAATNWVDSVVVRNTNTAQVIFTGTTNYNISAAGNGPIVSGDFRNRSLSFTMPTDANAYGGFAITVTADSADQVFEYNAGTTAELNNARVITVISAPDLAPVGLAVSPSSGSIRSGDTITVSWSDQNNGTVDTGAGFSDRVVVVNTNTSETLLNTTVFYNPAAAGNGAIPPGGSRPRSTTLQLPDGPRGVGVLEITVTADTSNQLPEANGGGTAEADNTVNTTVTSTIAAYPDLQVVNLSIVPGTLASGTNVTIQWRDTNAGTATVAANWYDHVTIVNTNTGATLLNTTVFYGTNALGPLTNGTARDRSYSFTLPNGTNAVGTLLFAITADTFNNVFEYNAGGTGESNNAASVEVGSSIAPYPDLQVINLDVQPATLASGTNVTIHWQDANIGNALARGNWHDRVTVVNTNSGVPLLDTTVLYDTNVVGVLTNGTARDRSYSFSLPLTTNGAGSLRFTVTADTFNNLFEYNSGGTGENNNSNSLVRVSNLTPLPDLVVTSITAPASALTDHAINVQFRVANQGLLAANGNIGQRLFISSTPAAGSGTLAAVTAFNGPLDASQGTNQTVTLQTPSVPGTYWLIVQTDGSDNVQELSEANNSYVSATPLTVQPAYTATLTVDVHSALANTPIPMHGLATLGDTGSPAAFAPVKIHVLVRGTDRTYNVLTAADGTFTNVFFPLPNEAGNYQVGAAFPAAANPPAQDTFTLIGMSITPVSLVNVIEGTSVTNATPVNNLSDVPLTGLSVTVVTNQPNLAVTASLDTNTLAGFGSVNLRFSITALDPSIFQSPVVLRVSSAEGAIATLTIIVRVEALRPRLVTVPASLNGSMLRGAQTPLAFTVANQGGVPTGPLQVILPNVPWLSLASSNQLPPLPAGTNTVITVLLNPASDLPLGDYNGTLVVQSTNAGLSVPYSFRAVSAATGSMLVSAEDEYTYFASGAPRVTNALVVISDALSRTPVVTNYTGSDGTILFTNLTEAFYIVDVSATNHSSFRQTALIAAGTSTNVVAFLTRQTVHYSFTVVPTAVQDSYIFTVDSTFETQVPIPVVTIEPASIDLSQYPDTEFQVLLTVSNHGLIDAEHVKLNIPSTSRLRLTPLVSDLGKLKANTSLTVPLMVKRIPPPPLGAAKSGVQKQDFLSGECSVTGEMLWNYLCGPSVVDKSTAFYAFDSTGCDLVALFRQVYHLVPDAPGPGPVIGSDDFFDYLESLNPVTDFEAPPGYHFECNSGPGVPFAASAVRSRAAGLARQGDSLRKQADNSVCAKVQLRLDQRGVLTRDAFKATLEIDNDVISPLQNVRVDLVITGERGTQVNTNFAITPAELSGLTAVDGTGTLAANSVGTANWTLIPTLDAAPTNGVALYLVGGTLHYTQDGSDLTVPLAPAPIQVFPQPELVVRYFHDRDVFSDDPFTPEIEPSIPYSLAVQVNNVGFGSAQSLAITSGKPQIVGNLKGLLIDFTILGVQLENRPATPALEVNFGQIAAGTNKTARWLFTSSLQGSFTNFSASFKQIDQFGKPRLSLIKAVEIHELTHIVDANGPLADGRPDFLINGVSDPDFLPDALYFSDGTTNSVNAVTDATVTGVLGGGNLSVTLNASATTGWTYFRFQDPGQGQYRLTKVLRSDNSEVPLGTNVWTTDRFIRGGNLLPIRTNLVHLLDYNSAGSYAMFYVATNSAADTTAPTSVVAALPSSSPPNFTVQWSGADNSGGGGIAFFDISVSVNDGPFTPWITNTTLTAAIYTGVTNSHYAFYSRATDAAGNREAAHASGDAQTTASAVGNTPPTLSFIPPQILVEGSLLSLIPSATDTDVPTQPLTWSLAPGAPAGALFSSVNGHITWQTRIADGGTTNTFTLVVSDSGSPSLSATQSFNVVVTHVNHAPSIVAVPPQISVDEQTLLSLQLSATDPDLPQEALTWQLRPGAPLGLNLDSSTGLLTWSPAESQGPGAYVVGVVVRDNGTPGLSDTNTFVISVREVNRAPLLAAISNQVASVQHGLVITNAASDPDIPGDLLTFSLDPGAPVGASIDPTSGVLTWTPAMTQGSTTNLITVRVTDNGIPPLSDTETFTVIVADYSALSIGTNIVQIGQSGSVPITLFSTAGLINLAFEIEVATNRLGSLAFTDVAPVVGSASVQVISSNRLLIAFSRLGSATFKGQMQLAALSFVALPNQSSAFMRLTPTNVAAAKADASALTNIFVNAGRVVVIGIEPLLEALMQGGSRDAILFGKPGSTYQLQYASDLNGGTWNNWLRVPLTNLFQVIQGVTLDGPSVFIRAYELVGDTSALDASLGAGIRSLTLYGRAGANYDLQFATSLAPSANWQTLESYAQTSAVQTLTGLSPTNSVIFYRIRKP